MTESQHRLRRDSTNSESEGEKKCIKKEMEHREKRYEAERIKEKKPSYNLLFRGAIDQQKLTF